MTITISKNKLLIMLICLLLVLNLSIFSTMAWMTDTSKVTNTFTVGKVDIQLEETDVDEDGKKNENEYHLIPGKEYVKDPKLKALFESITVPGFITKEQLATVGGFNIVVEGHAIQAAGFEDTTENGVAVKAIDNAWKAFDAEVE